ncbi:MAG: pilus assembly protein PilP [Nitrospirota bacterium]
MDRAILIGGLVGLAVLGACSQSATVTPAASPTASAPPAAVKAAPGAATSPGETAVAASQPETVSYNPSGRRDPFKSLIVVGEGKKNLEMLPPLQRHEVSELKYVAVVWGELGTYGMVEIPDGKGYAVRVGTRVGPNRGVVKRITAKDLTVVEQYVDFFGETRSRDIVLALRTREEGLE